MGLFWGLWQGSGLGKNDNSLCLMSSLYPRLTVTYLQLGLPSLCPTTTGKTAIISVYKPYNLTRSKSPTFFFNSPVVSHQTC